MKNNTMIPYNPKKDLETNYYNKTEVELLVAGGSGGSIDLSNYYKKLETYSKSQVDALVAAGVADLSDYYTKEQVDSLIPDISTKQDTLVSATNIKTINGESILGSGDIVISGGGAVDLSDYYKKTETETLLSNKVDKEAGKGLSTNDFTDTFKQALESNKVQNITTNSVTKKLVVTYTNGTFVDLNLDDVVTDVKVEGAVLDATTNVLTILSSDGGADVTVDLSVFVTNQTLSNALVGKADKIHTHTTSDITGLDTTLSNKVDKNETIVGATKTKITYDSNGLVTGGADLVEADLPNISQSKITNLVSDLSDKQDNLISGTNIKTINGKSVLGGGNMDLEGLSTMSNSKLNQETLTEFRHPVTGKPLYTKTINFGELPNATTKNVPHNAPNVEDINVDFNRSYVFNSSNPTQKHSVIWSHPTILENQWHCYVNTTSILVLTGVDRTLFNAIITVEYTKTTDTAESPVRLVGGGLDPDKDIVLTAGKGVIMTSANGTKYKLYIGNDGTLTTEVV